MLTPQSSRRQFAMALGTQAMSALAATRWAAPLAPLTPWLLSGCGHTPAVTSEQDRKLLAPSGTLRIGVYLGSPTSMVKSPTGQVRGLSVELGQALATLLGVPWRLVEQPRVASVLDALKAGQIDFTVTNATPARAQDMLFSAPLVELELGYLVLPGSRVSDIDGVDQADVRIGVSQGSSSQAALTQRLKNARVLPAASLQIAAEMLKAGRIDAFATNKAILSEMADGLPGARLLDGHWGFEQLAIAIPKGREAAMPLVGRFADEVRDQGLVKRAAERAGLRGLRGGT